MKLRAEFHGVIAENLREAIRDLIGVVHLNELIGGGAGRIGIEVEVLYALPLGVKSHNAGCAIRIGKSLRDEAYIASTYRLAKIGIVPHVAEMKLIVCCGAESFGIAEGDKLCASRGKGVKTGNAGATLCDRIGIIEIEVVDE